MKRVVVSVLVALLAVAGCAPPEEDSTKTNGGEGTKASKHKDKGNGGGDGAAASGPDNSTATKDGPLTWGNWVVVGPVQIRADVLDQYDVAMRVKNTGEAQDSGFFTLTILKGNRTLSNVDCTTAAVGPGQVAPASCVSMDDFIPGWTEVTIDNAF